jgi:hypothetical protein
MDALHCLVFSIPFYIFIPIRIFFCYPGWVAKCWTKNMLSIFLNMTFNTLRLFPCRPMSLNIPSRPSSPQLLPIFPLLFPIPSLPSVLTYSFSSLCPNLPVFLLFPLLLSYSFSSTVLTFLPFAPHLFPVFLLSQPIPFFASAPHLCSSPMPSLPLCS